MQEATRSHLKQAYLSHEEATDIIRLKLPYHANYNPNLFSQLEWARNDLDRDYFALIRALEVRFRRNNQNRHEIWKLCHQFFETLTRYLNKNRVELYGYLEQLYENDYTKRHLIESNQAKFKTAVYVINKTLSKYISPDASYGDKFHRELKAIWTILKWRYYFDRVHVYPLYPVMRESDWLEFHNGEVKPIR